MDASDGTHCARQLFPTLYFHSVCVIGSAAKIRALKGAGFWFLDDGDDSKRFQKQSRIS